MNRKKLAFTAMACILCFACGSKKEMDFSIVPVKGANGEYQYIDIAQKGKIVINPQFGEAHIFRDGLALVKASGNDGKWGYVNKKGEFAISPTYSMAQHFSEGVAWVQTEGQPPMLIDKKGKILLQIDSLTTAYPFTNGMSLISVYRQGQELCILVNKKGEIIATIEENFSSINDSLYTFKDKEVGKWGVKNINGKMATSPQFDNIDIFIDGMAIVKNGEKFGAIDKNGNFIISLQYDDLYYDSDGLFIAQIDKKYGWVNKKNEIIINPQYDSVAGFSGNKLAPVQIGGKWAYIDKKGQVAINPQFDKALPFGGDYAMAVNEGKIGFINQKGDFIVAPLYDLDNGNILEHIYASTQKAYNLPIEYLLSPGDNGKFLPYAKQFEKKETEEVKKETKEQTVSNILTDSRDSKKYKTVKIGTQVWMAENLNYNISGSKCIDCKKYGRLYNWNAAAKVCPSGWHLPSDAEWDTLIAAVGGSSTAGKHLKAKSGWGFSSPSKGGLNTYGFAALPGGGDISDGNFDAGVGYHGGWWSAFEDGANYAYGRGISDFGDATYYLDGFQKYLLSVRCVQDHPKEDKENKDAVIKNSHNFPIASSAKFLPYAKLDERIEAYKEMKLEEARKLEKEFIVAIEKDPAPAIVELEQEAKAWQKNTSETGKIEGRFFSFAVARGMPSCYECDDLGYVQWKAISKMKIGKCPAKSIWIMYYYSGLPSVWGNKIPSECKAITPKIIANYKGEEDY